MSEASLIAPDCYLRVFWPARRWREMPTRVISIASDTAASLRDLLRQAIEAYAKFEVTQRELRKRCSDLAGPVSSGEYPALCREDDRIEVVSRAEYLSEMNEGRWHIV